MPASLHVAEAISDEIVARLETCTRAQGAETDLGAAVFRGRQRIDDGMLPCSVLIEGEDMPARERGAGTQVRLMQRYLLQAYVPCDPDNPNTAAHAAIRDMKRALWKTGGKPDPTLGGKVKDVEYLGRDIGPRADGSPLVLAVIEIAIEYVERLSDP